MLPEGRRGQAGAGTDVITRDDRRKCKGRCQGRPKAPVVEGDRPGAAESGVFGATIKSDAERLGASLLRNILVNS